MVDDVELSTFLATHAAHDDLVRGGYVLEVAPEKHQVADPPRILRDIRSGTLSGRHAVVAAGLVLQCAPPWGSWVSQSPEELIDKLLSGASNLAL